MISLIIPTLNDERLLVPTLAALVSGAADGLIVEAVIADGGSTDGTESVADVAGCRFLSGAADVGLRLSEAAAATRAPWLMFIRPGAVLDDGWIREVRGFLDVVSRRGEAGRRAAVFRLGVEEFGAAAGLTLFRARLAFLLGLGARPAQGLVIAREHYRAIGGHRPGAGSEAALLRRLGRGRSVTLRARATAVSA